MSYTHEYIVFDEAKLEKILKLRWSSFDKKFSWSEWENSKEMLVEFGLAVSDVDRVDEILARKTVRQTIEMSDTPDLFLHVMLDQIPLWDDGVDMSEESGFESAAEIVSCACLAFVQGRISFEMMAAACDLHYRHCNPAEYLPAEVAERWGVPEYSRQTLCLLNELL